MYENDYMVTVGGRSDDIVCVDGHEFDGGHACVEVTTPCGERLVLEVSFDRWWDVKVPSHPRYPVRVTIQGVGSYDIKDGLVTGEWGSAPMTTGRTE
uniref:Uncharacterized protein n=1 Tax=viral metagenome TaxID=1070528 RepID=A0A6M3L1H7_9ZZZZ